MLADGMGAWDHSACSIKVRDQCSAHKNVKGTSRAVKDAISRQNRRRRITIEK